MHLPKKPHTHRFLSEKTISTTIFLEKPKQKQIEDEDIQSEFFYETKKNEISVYERMQK